MVVREMAGVVIAGMAVGLLLSALVAPRLGGMLYGIPALDPVTFAASAMVLLGVAWIAAFVPAWRAAGTDPVEALRVS
jgi:ABC-type antimicrobial peptide transport system permease subunit